MRELGVNPADNSPAVLPTAGNVRSQEYPISRGLYFYTRKEPEGVMKQFVDYVLSDAGQAIANDVGYFSNR